MTRNPLHCTHDSAFTRSTARLLTARGSGSPSPLLATAFRRLS